MTVALLTSHFSLLTCVSAHAETQDPTAPTAGMADVLKRKLPEAADMKLHALVVGAEGEGVALLGKTAKDAQIVRAGSMIVETIEGVRVTARIKSVTPAGVELATSAANGAGHETRDERRAPNNQTIKQSNNQTISPPPIFFPGSFTSLAAPTNKVAELVRHLESEKVPIDRLMRLIADQTGVNISSSDAAAEKTVSIFLRNVAAEAAVEEICRATGLWFRRDPDGGVVRITTMAEYAESLSSFREEQTRAFTLLYPNVVEIASVIYGLYPERTLLSLGEEEFLEDDEYDLSRRFRRFRVLEENGNSQFMEMQAPQASSSGGRSGGGNFSFSRGNALSRLTQWDRLFERGKIGRGQFGSYLSPNALLAADEAKRLEGAVRAGDTNAYEAAYQKQAPGAANIFVSMSRRNNKLIVRTSDVKAMDEITRLVRELDVPTPMVLMELKIMELDVTDDFSAGFNWGLSEVVTSERTGTLATDASTGAQTLTYGETSTRINGIQAGSLAKGASSLTGETTFDKSGQLTDGSVTKTYSTAANLAANLSQGGAAVANPTFAFSILSDRIASSISLMQQDGKAKILSTPTLLTANNEVSRIFNGSEYPLVTGWSKAETVVSSDSPAIVSPATAEIERKDVGTMLLITPNINSDKTVTLHLLQENSAIAAEQAQIPVDGSSGETKGIDFVESRSLTGTFVAKDGMTILAGGLIRESDESVYWRTPFLGSIPLLGWLFRGTEKAKRRTELVILLTPHIIMTPVQGGKISAELMKQLSDHPAADGRPNMGTFREGDDPTAKKHSITDDIKALVE